MKKNGEKFECYSRKMHGFFIMKGIRYDDSFKHNVTGKTCWTYTMTDELSKAIKEWQNARPDNKGM